MSSGVSGISGVGRQAAPRRTGRSHNKPHHVPTAPLSVEELCVSINANAKAMDADAKAIDAMAADLRHKLNITVKHELKHALSEWATSSGLVVPTAKDVINSLIPKGKNLNNLSLEEKKTLDDEVQGQVAAYLRITKAVNSLLEVGTVTKQAVGALHKQSVLELQHGEKYPSTERLNAAAEILERARGSIDKLKQGPVSTMPERCKVLKAAAKDLQEVREETERRFGSSPETPLAQCLESFIARVRESIAGTYKEFLRTDVQEIEQRTRRDSTPRDLGNGSAVTDEYTRAMADLEKAYTIDFPKEFLELPDIQLPDIQLADVLVDLKGVPAGVGVVGTVMLPQSGGDVPRDRDEAYSDEPDDPSGTESNGPPYDGFPDASRRDPAYSEDDDSDTESTGLAYEEFPDAAPDVGPRDPAYDGSSVTVPDAQAPSPPPHQDGAFDIGAWIQLCYSKHQLGSAVSFDIRALIVNIGDRYIQKVADDVAREMRETRHFEFEEFLRRIMGRVPEKGIPTAVEKLEEAVRQTVREPEGVPVDSGEGMPPRRGRIDSIAGEASEEAVSDEDSTGESRPRVDGSDAIGRTSVAEI